MVRFDGFTLGPLDLGLEAGERLAVVGPNGAGKSTTMRGMAGRLETYEGSAIVNGLEVRDAAVAVRGTVGVLPEELLGFGWMTVADHLDFLPSFYATWDREYAQELRQLLEIPAGTPLADLSKGNRVKLSLLVAEAFRPPVLLLDEPTSGVDPLMRRRVLDLVDQCAPRGGGRTVLFSTHILEDLHRIADRVVLLKDGRIIRDTSLERFVDEAGGASISEVIFEELADA
jgi:ABC-2 type transport system ATP-binding protein